MGCRRVQLLLLSLLTRLQHSCIKLRGLKVPLHGLMSPLALLLQLTQEEHRNC